MNDAPFRLISEVSFGNNVVVYSFANLYGCRIGDETQIGTFVEIQRGAAIGKRCEAQNAAGTRATMNPASASEIAERCPTESVPAPDGLNTFV